MIDLKIVFDCFNWLGSDRFSQGNGNTATDQSAQTFCFLFFFIMYLCLDWI